MSVTSTRPSSRPEPTPASTARALAPVSRADLAGLARRLEGTLAGPGEPGYELAAPYNVLVPVAPRAVVSVASAADVAETVRFAGRHGLRVAVQRTGHGALPVGDDAILVHTGRLDELSLDVPGRRARIGAGLTWQDVLDAATPHGLAPLCGSAPAVGVAGFLTGGGLGPIARTAGFSSDHVTAIEVVTGDGLVRRATPTEHSELFWGLRGGKSTLGIVTAVEIGMPHLPTIYGGCLYFDGSDAESVRSVLVAWRELCATLPEAGTTSLAVVAMPPLPGVPEPLAGRTTVAVRFAWTGEAAQAEHLLDGVLAAGRVVLGGVGVMPYAAIAAIHGDPVDPMPVLEQTALLADLPDEAVEAFLAAAGPGSGSPQVIVELRQLGGAASRAPQHPDALCHRDAAYIVNVIGVPVPDVATVLDHGRALVGALVRWSTGGALPNFAPSTGAERAGAVYDADTLLRLRELAQQYDPAGVLAGGASARVA